MKSTRNTAGLAATNQIDTDDQVSSDRQQSNDNTMALVYPDGRVMNVKVGQQKS